MRVELDPGSLDDVDDAIDRLTQDVADVVASRARRRCPVRTGHLLLSIVRERSNIYIGGPGAEHWADVEFGTLPHVIRPRVAKALYWPGADHPVAVVHHPGTPEQAVMRGALYQEVTSL